MTVDAYQLRCAAGLPIGAIRLPRDLTADEAAALRIAWAQAGAAATLPAPDMEWVPFVAVPARVMVAMDVGCRERVCQAGMGDPPMDCGWPDCGCGLIIVVRPPVYPSVPRLSPEGRYYICDQCGREWQPGTPPGCEPCAKAYDERDRQAGSRA